MKLCALFFLALAIVACAPPYSAELNAAAGLAGQMTLLGTMGPVNSPDGDSTTAIKFLPAKPTSASATLDQLGISSGFLVSESNRGESLTFAYQSGNSAQVLDSGASFSLAGADPHYPLYEYDVITTTATENIIVFYLGDPTSPANNTYQCFTATPNGPFQSSSPPTTMTGLYGGRAVLAAQVFPLSAAPYDRFSFLLDPIATPYGEGAPTFALPAFAGGIPTTSNVPLLGAGSRALYYQGPLGSPSYASYFTAGNWVCFQWTAATSSTPTRLTGVTSRIDAVLTDGDLISTQDGTLTVYDLNGTRLNSVPLGGMQFCYEAYVGATPYVFFSLSLEFSHQSWAFRVYAIPTSRLRSLKG